MKQLTIASLLMLSAPVWASTSASIDLWQTDFKNGRLPSGVTVSADGQQSVKDRYKFGWTENGWSVSAVGRVYCAVSPTSTMSETPVENVMTLPSVAIPEEGTGALLRWSARSMIPQLPESYEIRLREAGTEYWKVVCRVEAEEEQMTTRALPLGDYAGKEIEIRFVCTSVNRYMLALGGIYVGVPGAPALTALATSRRFAENAEPRGAEYTVTGTLFNGGAPLPAGSELRVVADGEIAGAFSLSADLPSCGTLEYEIPAAFPDNATTAYTLLAVDPDGEEYQLLSSDVTRSGFARNLMVDEGTGIWCNNCPRGTLDIAKLERQYPGQVIPVCTHTDDIIANENYWSELKFYAVPYMMLNRQRASAGGDTSRFSSYLNEPTMASIEVVDVPPYQEGVDEVKATVEVMFDREMGEPGRYGVGYVFTSPYHKPSGSRWMQHNILTTAASEQYYFLPTVIPAGLSFYEHVSVGSEHAFDPITFDILDGLTALEPYTPYRLTLDFGDLFQYPTLADDPDAETIPEELTLVAFVMDREEGTVLNAVSYPLQKEYFTPSGVTTPSVAETVPMRVAGERLLFTLPEAGCRYELTLRDPAGKTLATRRGEGRGETSLTMPEGRGVIIATLTTPSGVSSLKIMK